MNLKSLFILLIALLIVGCKIESSSEEENVLEQECPNIKNVFEKAFSSDSDFVIYDEDLHSKMWYQSNDKTVWIQV